MRLAISYHSLWMGDTGMPLCRFLREVISVTDKENLRGWDNRSIPMDSQKIDEHPESTLLLIGRPEKHRLG